MNSFSLHIKTNGSVEGLKAHCCLFVNKRGGSYCHGSWKREECRAAFPAFVVDKVTRSFSGQGTPSGQGVYCGNPTHSRKGPHYRSTYLYIPVGCVPPAC